MGREIVCRASLAGQSGEGRALLETHEVLFRGTPRFRVRFGEMRALTVHGGELRFESPAGKVVLELGPAEAERWLSKIKNPPGLMDKLGVKVDTRVVVAGLDDPAVLAELRTRVESFVTPRSKAPCDCVLLGVVDPSNLAQLARLRERIAPEGMIWAIWPKGRKELREDHIRAAALACGLVDVKVASVTSALSGLKLVIPKSQRGARTRR